MSKPWTITWGMRSWSDNDVLGSDLALVHVLAGGQWDSADPWTGPTQLMAWIVALEKRSSGRELDEVMLEVFSSPGDEIVDALQERDVEGADNGSS